ncbi:MAG TPA: zinc ribbon domain-containing protein [Candidatus Sulfomarinibacteraceae bacterium]|nr:zinc ribbon domain-containing protein [Candidatus Sulfomarinibacteraceae bacterium]
MPRYDFRCHDCTTVFEVKRSMSRADEPTDCPDCGSANTYKMLSRVAVHAGGSTTASAPAPQPASKGGGCCGGACACGH